MEQIPNKQETIIEMFNQIAPTYDKANRVLSMGIDISWRKKACQKAFELLGDRKSCFIVDVACGTGDMMSFWYKEGKKSNIDIQKIIGVDPSVGMVEVGKTKFPDFNFFISEATNIPLEDNSADILSISYGIRNVVKRKEAFREFARVVNSGGLVVILEFTKDTKKGFLKSIKEWYLNKVLPFLGGIISSNKKAYKYLPESIENFLTSQMLQDELKEAGFETCYVKGFSMDISTLLIAKKIS